MVFAARLTQQGHKIASMDDLMELYEKSFSVQTVAAMGALPHPTIQKFAVITVAIVGASRRFLAQITRHQNEVKFMSASLQYSNYTGQADFAVPYSIMTAPAVVRELYLKSCNESMKCYEALCTAGSGHDAAGYATPQGLRNVLLISATPYQWKHIISQRVCRRNTDETRIVLLKVWKELYELSPYFVCPITDRAFLSDGSMSGRENDLRTKTAGKYDARGYFGKRLSCSLGRGLPMKIKLIDFGVPEHQRPYRPHGNDAGADVYLPHDYTLQPGEIAKIPLGFGLEIPDGYAGYIFPRTSMAVKGLVCELPPVDSGYRGEIHAIISNVSNQVQSIFKGARIGQLVITPIVIADFVTDLGTERGTGSFGSTGE